MGCVILFVRVSTAGQRLESQEDLLRKAALADGYKESDFIIIGKKESAIKLSEEEREGLNELKSVLEKEAIDCIYIAELSRLSRQPKILYSIRELLFQKRIQLKCLNPQFSLLTEDRSKYDSTANIIFSLFGVMAEQEMIEKKERFARGKQRKALEGKYNGGAIPFGYCVDKEQDNLIVINDKEAEIVRLIFDLYEAGFSQPKLAKEMRERGFHHVTISMINNILNNPSYCGIKRKSAGATYERSYPPVISKEKFDRCRSIAQNNNTTTNKARKIYYADKLIICPTCGGYWSASGSKNSYHCSSAYRSNSIWNYENHNKEKCTNKASLSINILDSLLWFTAVEREVEYILAQNNNAIRLYQNRENVLKEKISGIAPRRAELKAKNERLKEMYIDGMSKRAYVLKKEEITSELNAIKSEEIQYKDELASLAAQIKIISENSQKLSSDEKRRRFAKQTKLITNDSKRYEIIHRQIKFVIVLPKRANYPFKSGRKDVNGKFIRVHFYPILGKEVFDVEDLGADICTQEYYVVPNGGNGAIILELIPKDIKRYPNVIHIYNHIYKEGTDYSYLELQDQIYLNRFYDTTKIKKREKERESKRKVIANRLTLQDVSKLSGLSYYTLYDKIKKRKLKASLRYGRYYIKPEDAEELIRNLQKKDSNTETT
jgi:DNA invertase Pin-like site-specific DNA recombinase